MIYKQLPLKIFRLSARIDARAFAHSNPIASFDLRQFDGVYDLYHKFYEWEVEYQKTKTGLFSKPENRACGYAALIHKLLRTDPGYAMADGSPIPDSDMELAN